ncbi:MAG: hypothetical protein EBZ47_02675 [Chlamydiae bacterium]|nr:hypothetical protein [Chlamydiota bacterium]
MIFMKQRHRIIVVLKIVTIGMQIYQKDGNAHIQDRKIILQELMMKVMMQNLEKKQMWIWSVCFEETHPLLFITKLNYYLLQIIIR